jgi:hypothetical protein
MSTTETPSEARGEWSIEPYLEDSGHPEFVSYKILEANPEAGKKGVCYAGSHFRVCEVDDENDAKLIAAAPKLLAAVKRIAAVLGHLNHEEVPGSQQKCRACSLEALIAEAGGAA